MGSAIRTGTCWNARGVNDLPRKAAYVVTVALLAIAGVSERLLLANRQDSDALRVAVDQLAQLPSQIGPWMASEFPLDELTVRVIGCADYRNLRFVHHETGRTVSAAIMVGLPGPMSVHMPEACYASAGYTQLRSSLELVSVDQLAPDAGAGELIRVDFVEPKSELPVRVYQGWFDGVRWSRPRYPRLAFFNRTHLFKLQVYASLTPAPFAEDQAELIDGPAEFLRDALPVLTRLLETKVHDQVRSH